VSNFESIFNKTLVLIDGQYATDVGLIDILARDPQANAIVVIELKKGREADKVVGQILRYMGWVKDNVCQPGQEVHGIIVCKEADERLLYALKMVNNVAIKYYRVDFTLQDQPRRP
jgi:restriction system protein